MRNQERIYWEKRLYMRNNGGVQESRGDGEKVSIESVNMATVEEHLKINRNSGKENETDQKVTKF